MAVPVHIVAGFLGAGKTSALRAQLQQRAEERVAVIVNDFGEASLDEATLSEAKPFRITSISGACVCCTAPEGFVDALGAVLEGRPERLLIEPTGLARPQDLVDTIRRSPHGAALELRPVVVLVDPKRLAGGGGEPEALLSEQVEAADILVANRTDLCSDAELARFDAWAARLWPEPLAVHRTTHGQIPASLLEWPDATSRPRAGAADRGHGHSTQGFVARSWCWPPDVVFSSGRLRDALQALAKGEGAAPLERFKGVFRTREGVFRYEVSGGVLHEALSAHRRDSRADAIFRGAGEAVLDDVGSRLEAGVLSARELEASANEIEVALPDGRIARVDREALAGLADGVADVSTLFPKRSGRAARVGRLFESLGIARTGEAVVVAADGFASEPVAVAILSNGLLLHSLGEEALPAQQGGPFRLLIPPDVPDAPTSCANVKAVARIVVRS